LSCGRNIFLRATTVRGKTFRCRRYSRTACPDVAGAAFVALLCIDKCYFSLALEPKESLCLPLAATELRKAQVSWVSSDAFAVRVSNALTGVVPSSIGEGVFQSLHLALRTPRYGSLRRSPPAVLLVSGSW